MKRHINTWRAFVDHLSVMGANRFTEVERQAMAEALSFAVPQGPVGIECADGCANHDDSNSIAIVSTVEILERALGADRMSPRERAEFRMAVNERSHDHARVMFPHVWKLVRKLAA